jgi:hypothetical protein
MFDGSSTHLVEFEVTIAEFRNARATIVASAREPQMSRARNCNRFHAEACTRSVNARDASLVAERVVNNPQPQLIDL